MAACFFCGAELFIEKSGRDDVCPRCKSDVRCCKNCRFYDERAHNKCLEPQAEWVGDREKANHCDFFALRSSFGAGRADPTQKARDAAKKLFGG